MRKIHNVICVILLITLLSGSGFFQEMCVMAANQNMGGSVTDTLTVKVGYWGMSESDYVEKATYHWTELDDQFGGALQTHQQAYSFFRESDDGGYQTIIDSARGFYIRDLLKYAGINLNDIEGISFYTQDQSVGYFTKFSYEELFGVTRYFFNDLSFYTQQTVNDSGKPTGEYSIDPAVWSQAVEVEPMLALEDGWLSYEPGNEHTSPVYEGLSTGNRFRLLFGQTTPDESRTNQTAKYTHSLYVALNGTPKITTEDVPLADQIGSGYTAEFTMSTSDDSFNEALKQFMEWNSSDENVLKITDVSIQDDPQYEDAVRVRITYDILSAGNASISGSFFGAKVTTRNGNDKIEMKQPAGDSNSDGDRSGEEQEKTEENSGTDRQEESGRTEDQSSNTEQSGNNAQADNRSSGQQGNNSSTVSGNSGRSTGSAGVTTDRSRTGSAAAIGNGSAVDRSTQSGTRRTPATGTSRNSDVTEGRDKESRKNSIQDPQSVDPGVTVYELNGDIGRLLRGSNTETQQTDQASDPEYDTLEVREPKAADHRAAILATVILLMAAGGAVGILRYLYGIGIIRKRKRGRLRYV